MKNSILLFSFFFISLSFGLNAQTTQASFAGVWKMNPSNPSHNLSKMNIFDNGSSMSITIKKLNLKNIPAK
ncbi:MAG: hypothetical protein ACKN86_12640, partial [Crocinitomicaceae bacterium]